MSAQTLRTSTQLSGVLVFCPSFTVHGIELGIRQRNIDGSNIFLQMRDLGCAWNGQHDRTPFEDPCERDLARSGSMGLGYVIQDRAALGETACSQRVPGNEA